MEEGKRGSKYAVLPWLPTLKARCRLYYGGGAITAVGKIVGQPKKS
jgi:hypothetical protein